MVEQLDPAGRSSELLERIANKKNDGSHDLRCPWAWDYGYPNYCWPKIDPACHCERLLEEDDSKFIHSDA